MELKSWRLAVLPHARVRQGFDARTAADLQGVDLIPATVPGNFELDLCRAGLLDDPYYGDNVLALQKLEDRHLWYVTEFEIEKKEGFFPTLTFEGIDTVSEIYLDGALLGKTENMLIPHTFSPEGLTEGTHELVVHILPSAIVARQYRIPASCKAQAYNQDSLVLRKAPYMYGWDIMPRTVSGGLWRPVRIDYRPKDRLEDLYLTTVAINGDTARLYVAFRVETDADLMTELSYRIEGVCGDATFSHGGKLFSAHTVTRFAVNGCKLWMPRGYGEQNLYHVRVTLFRNGVACDYRELDFGIRIVELERTSEAGEDGEFCFRINGRKVFALGTNWVPTDAFPSRHPDYQIRALEMLTDLNCNMVRTWGGNAYPDQAFYDFCDRNGIMVWQDFALGCAHYDESPRMQALLAEEADVIVRQFRNHPSLVLWAGDNECDETAIYTFRLQCNGRTVLPVDPNQNLLTREILAKAVRQQDFARPYLPSSPYFDERAFRTGNPSERHLWGPRDFFKGDYYGKANAHFASETGYHGCPSPESLQKFIPADHLELWGDTAVCNDPIWLTHAACMVPDQSDPYAYRIPLMSRQVERLFGSVPADLDTYALQSQISQAEAKKFFIERFRIGKWRRTGILWWNLIDGWPQISDAVVDWYGCKKLAYSYIKRSQQSFCLMCDEPNGQGELTLYAVNDRQAPATVRIAVQELSANVTVLELEITVPENCSLPVATFPQTVGGFYRLTWQGDAEGINHFTASIADTLDFDTYLSHMKACGFDKDLCGFDE